jgi:hypothetical protein
MALPIAAIILDKIETALSAITIANGYQVTVSGVFRISTIAGYDRTPPGNYVIQFIAGDPVPNEQLDVFSAQPVKGWTLPVELGMIYRPSDTSTTPIDEALLQFWADVVRCIMADPQWEQYANDTIISAPESVVTENFVGMTAMMNVHFRTKEGDPYQLPWNPPAWTKIIDGGFADTTDYTAILEGNGS